MSKTPGPVKKQTSPRTSSRFSGFFSSVLSRKKKRKIVLLIDDEDKWLKEIAHTIAGLSVECEVLTCKDAIDGLMMAKQYSEDLRVCLIDMVMPVLSGLEFLNRARAEPSLSHVKFGLMTEFSAQKKNLSHFMVSDEKGQPVAVYIKPIHASVMADLLETALESDRGGSRSTSNRTSLRGSIAKSQVDTGAAPTPSPPMPPKESREVVVRGRSRTVDPQDSGEDHPHSIGLKDLRDMVSDKSSPRSSSANSPRSRSSTGDDGATLAASAPATARLASPRSPGRVATDEQSFPGVRLTIVESDAAIGNATGGVASPRGSHRPEASDVGAPSPLSPKALARSMLRRKDSSELTGSTTTSTGDGSPMMLGKSSLRRKGVDGIDLAGSGSEAGSPRFGSIGRSARRQKSKGKIDLVEFANSSGPEPGSSSPKLGARTSLRRKSKGGIDPTDFVAATASPTGSPRLMGGRSSLRRKSKGVIIDPGDIGDGGGGSGGTTPRSSRRTGSKGQRELAEMMPPNIEKVLARVEQYDDLDAMMFQAIGSLDRGNGDVRSGGDLNWDDLKQ